MTIGDDIGKALAVPAAGVPMLVAKVAGAVALAALAGFMIWQSFFASGAAQQKHEETAARSQGLVNQAMGNAGANASNVVAGNAAKEIRTHEITRDHYHEIIRQPGAADPVSDPVWGAFVRSVCMRASAAGLSDCQRLREADTAGVADGGAERAPAVEPDGGGTGRLR